MNGGGHWLFTGGLDKDGYGRIWIHRRKKNLHNSYFIHRLVYAFYKGNVPKNKEVHHKCLTRNCCNPDHLELKTRQQNMAERWGRAGGALEVDRS